MDKRIRPFEDIAPLNVSINLFISSFDSIAETTMDFGLTFIMRLRWQDPRMMFPDIQGEKTLNNKTILTMDLKFLDELWVPGKATITISYHFLKYFIFGLAKFFNMIFYLHRQFIHRFSFHFLHLFHVF